MNSNSNNRPFGLLVQDTAPMTTRGYVPAPKEAYYDPQTQTVPQFIVRDIKQLHDADPIYATGVFGDTEPTTSSSIYSTGIFNDDTDEGADDTGTD
jgi:hypothetical protein